MNTIKDDIRERLIDVCNTILYSNDMQKVAAAYNIFFTQYRPMIVQAADVVHLSCVEDVIYKIIYDEPVDTTEKYGYNLQYSPFPKFISMVKEQEEKKRILPTLKIKAKSVGYPLANLKNFIIITPTDKEFEEKNSYIKNLLHQCYIKEI